MDVNGTRLHLLLGRRDWEESIEPPIDIDVCFDELRHTLGLRPRPFVFPTRPGSARLVPDDRRGAAIDRFGNHFWIGPDRSSVLVLGSGQSEAFQWWPTPTLGPSASTPGAFEACAVTLPDDLVLSGLAITGDHYLLAGVLNLPAAGSTCAGLFAFDLAKGGPPVVLAWPTALGVRPFDLAALPGGGIVVLDVADPVDSRPARLWHLDRWFRVVDLGNRPVDLPDPPQFAPTEPSIETDAGSANSGTFVVSDARASNAAVLDVGWAVAVDALADGTVLVLDRFDPDGHFEVSRWRCGVRIPFGLRLDAPVDPATAFTCTEQRANARDVLAGAVGHDFTAIPLTDGSGLARLFVVDERGDQAFEFVVDDDGADLVTVYHPLRLFSGKAVVSDGTQASYDLDARWYPVPTQPVGRYATDGEVVLAPDLQLGRAFDGGAPGTVWHRLVADAAIPPGTSLKVETRAADELAVLDTQPWLPEPAPYRRGDGSEVPYHRYACGSSAGGLGSWELLFQRAVGRYLQIRLTLHGDGRRTPRLWAVRLHYPRYSYLQEYLPDIYKEDRESASFLDRYLSNVEGLYTTLEGRIANVQRLVDPQTIDAEYLPWLASWVGGVVEPNWDPVRTRLFVRYAARMFTRRGTPRGLLEAIRLAIHPCPTEAIFDTQSGRDPFGVRVVERFRTQAVSGMVFGDPNDAAGPRFSSEGGRWTLGDGGSQLQTRWQAFLSDRALTGPTSFPVLTPTDAGAAVWSDFVHSELAVPYARVGTDDEGSWRAFLAQRYRRIGDYGAAWNATGSSGPADFGAIPLPTGLPADGAPLQDWLTFVSTSLPAARAAHRATVLVPIRFDDSDEARAQRLGRVRRVVEVERPAHTLVDVQPYWAAFRVGEARVGLETIVGEGGRYVDIVLGAGRLAHSVIPGGGAWRSADRLVLGRDRVGRSTVPAKSGGS